MSTQPFAGTRVPSALVNRIDEMSVLHRAIYQPGDGLRVVLIEGAGGFGKTRLLHETLWLAGHPGARKASGAPPSPPAGPAAMISDLVDFVDVRLHTFSRFLSTVRDALIWHPKVDFPKYDAARAHHQRQLAAQADYPTLREAASRAETAFFEDYRAIARQQRLIWTLDTAEQLGLVASEWLLDRGLLKPEELSFDTQRRMLELFRTDDLPNTTVLLAGRGEEGKRFFKAIKQAAGEAGAAFELISIPMHPFTADDTQAYFRVLADEWKQKDPESEITAYMRSLADDADRARVLWLYTGGQPVRLSLYADVLAEGRAEPELLQVSLEDARQRVKWDAAKNEPDPEALKSAQLEIEGKFIDTLFANVGTLRAQILIALVRARRGLDAHRLHFILDRMASDPLKDWRENLQRLDEIEAELAEMQKLSFVKRRPDGRTVLQDEMYRIYDAHVAASKQARQDETDTRHWLYGQLADFADHEVRILRDQQRADWKAYERSLQLATLSPARAVMMRFPEQDEVEREERDRLRDAVRDIELERLHYILLRDPDRGFNDEYFELADRLWLANDEEAIAQTQAELWRFLNDRYVRYFITTPEREARRQRGESYWDVLARVAEQENVVRWLKLFALRGEWRRAIQLAEEVETAIESLTGYAQVSWKHTLSVGERAAWREYARTFLGGKEETLQAVSALEAVVANLVQLSRQGIAERQEAGFVRHPAEFRLRRIIGVTYNNLGYAYVTIGQYRRAITAYANALPYLREARFEAQLAVTSNNLARALSETGLNNRATRVCRDAIELHERQGAEASLAYAHNTLALIHNNGLRPEDAWIAAAIAAAYFRRLGNARGLGLSLLELGEALRRLSTFESTLPDTPGQLQEAAEQVLQEALGIFSDPQSPFSREVLRRIEAEIELGCLFRDRARKEYAPDASRRERRQLEAMRHLTTAVDLAQEQGYPQLELDAQVNIAWAHYFGGDFTAAEAVLQSMQTLLPQSAIFRAGQPPPASDAAENYIYQQLSKVWALHGLIAFSRFHHRADKELAPETRDRAAFHQVVSQDPEASQRLWEAAEAFTLSLAYAQLFAPRSGALISAYNALYDRLKRFSVVAMIDFTTCQREAQKKYRVTEIETQNLVDMREFLLQCFGDYRNYQMAGGEGEQ
jgi:hypothetical protein